MPSKPASSLQNNAAECGLRESHFSLGEERMTVKKVVVYSSPG
jgi:hypothetical protein